MLEALLLGASVENNNNENSDTKEVYKGELTGKDLLNKWR